MDQQILNTATEIQSNSQTDGAENEVAESSDLNTQDSEVTKDESQTYLKFNDFLAEVRKNQ